MVWLAVAIGMSAPSRLLEGRLAATAQHDVEAIAERVFGLGDFKVEAGDQAIARGLIGDAVEYRIERQERIARKVHLRDEARGEPRSEQRVVDVVRAPGVLMVAPGIGAGLDRRVAVAALAIGERASGAAKMGIERRIMLVALVVVPAGGVGLPDLDHRLGDGPSVLVDNPSLDDDAFA